jgi:hypothetical protein
MGITRSLYANDGKLYVNEKKVNGSTLCVRYMKVIESKRASAGPFAFMVMLFFTRVQECFLLCTLSKPGF